MSNVGLCPMCPPGTKPALLTGGYCSWHFHHPEPVVVPQGEAPETKVKVEPEIKPVSKQMQAILRQYGKLKQAFLHAYGYCEILLDGCTGRATDIHHMRGRGKWMLKTEYWKRACRHCHTEITKNSADAIEQGHSMKRND